MSSRFVRTLAVGVGAGALVLGMAAPAMAADPLPLNNKVKLAATESVVVTATLEGACDPAQWIWTTRVVGQKSGIKTVEPAAPACVDDVATWTVTTQEPATKRKKANAVVKFIATQPVAEGSTVAPERKVFSLVVKVNHKATGKPEKPGKPTS